MEVKKILREFIKERILSYIAGILILIAASVISLRIPKILGKVTDMLNKGQGTVNEIRIQLLLMVGFAVLGFVLRFIWRYFLVGNCRHVESYLRRKLLHIFRLFLLISTITTGQGILLHTQ